mmetsp:Transcript_28646/g.44533  ORF Transcript_28646/g.44533 Transcript_28646/m.44533 type:complete len:157 (+) Transcript_28646:106-576(+)
MKLIARSLSLILFSVVTLCQARSHVPAASAAPASACINPSSSAIHEENCCTDTIKTNQLTSAILGVRGGVSLIPAGYNPFGYAITDFGLKFLEFDGALDCDVGRFLASLKSGRKRFNTIKEQWLEVVRVSKKGQSLRIYRTLDDLIKFCLQAGFIN